MHGHHGKGKLRTEIPKRIFGEFFVLFCFFLVQQTSLLYTIVSNRNSPLKWNEKQDEEHNHCWAPSIGIIWTSGSWDYKNVWNKKLNKLRIPTNSGIIPTAEIYQPSSITSPDTHITWRSQWIPGELTSKNFQVTFSSFWKKSETEFSETTRVYATKPTTWIIFEILTSLEKIFIGWTLVRSAFRTSNGGFNYGNSSEMPRLINVIKLKTTQFFPAAHCISMTN